MSNQYNVQIQDMIITEVFSMDRYDILCELRVAVPRFTTPLDTLQDMLAAQRFADYRATLS
jgi:hypothetical protein